MTAWMACSPGPYEWWDTAAIKALGIPNAATVIANGNASNPLHKIFGKSRAILYVDSIMGYVAPRLAVSMGIQTSVGIRENNLSSNVTVAPNPAKNQVVIHNNWTNRSLVAAELVDINGRSVQKMNLSPVHNVVNLNASAGIYMLRLQFNDGVGVQKLVIE
jgi:Secretion system C-terminal sorting domain